jgi:hypothetical protein
MVTAWSRHRRIGAGAATIAAAAALAGCSTVSAVTAPLTAQVQVTAGDIVEATQMTPPGVNPASPIAADALRAEQIGGPVPSFTTVPPKPGDIRPAYAYKTEVVGLVGDRRDLNRWTAANPPGVDDSKVSEAYAAAQRERVGHEAPVKPEKKGDTEAFAKKGRQAVGQPETAPAKSPN